MPTADPKLAGVTERINDILRDDCDLIWPVERGAAVSRIVEQEFRPLVEVLRDCAGVLLLIYIHAVRTLARLEEP